MNSSKMIQEIAETFGNTVASDEKLVAECVNMCTMFNMTPESLFYKWEALSFNSTRSINIFTADSAASLKASIQREIATDNAKKQQVRARLFGPAIRGRAPAPRTHPAKAATSSTVVNVKEEPDQVVGGPIRVTFKGPMNDEVSRKARAYRYMYENVRERSSVLDERIEEIAAIIKAHYKLNDLGIPAMSTEEEVTVVGRITLDVESSSSPRSVKLNEASLTIESSRSAGGSRVPLKFLPAAKVRGGAEGAGALGFFPGAIVALKGKNGSGHNGYFLVSEIIALPQMKPSLAATPQSRLGTPFSMCIACGPYTLDADLNYVPWYKLLETLKSTKPDVVLLIGPYIDSAHSKIKIGEIDQTPSQLFKRHFTHTLRDFLSESSGSIVLVVPGTRDVISDHAVYPQCELDAAELTDGHPRIHMLPNPCRFAVNDVSFAVTSVDVLFHVKKEEYVKSATEVGSVPDESGRDLISASCRHILQQRSFYPVFPVPFDLVNEVNLDVSHSDMLKLDFEAEADCAPDVLISPSRLIHFAKRVQNTTFINPSFVTRGSYATLTLAPGGKPLKERIVVETGKHDGSSR